MVALMGDKTQFYICFRQLPVMVALMRGKTQFNFCSRQLPVMVALMRGKTQFVFGEFRQRNFMNLYTYILGLLELLIPQVFHKSHASLGDILEEYFTLLKVRDSPLVELGWGGGERKA